MDRGQSTSPDRGIKRRTTPQLSGAPLLTGLAGCLGSDGGDPGDDHDWPMHAFDLANTGHTPARGPSEPVELWAREIGGVKGSPVVVDDTVYACGGWQLHAMDAETGEDHWTVEMDAPLNDSPAVDQDTVYVLVRSWGDNPHLLVAFDFDGDTQWSTSLSALGLVGSPKVVDGIVYVYSGAFGVRAFDAESGEEVWSEDELPNFTTYFALVDGVVHTGRTALDAKTGQKLWEQDEEFPVLHQWGTSAANGMLYTASDPGKLLAIDASSGEIQWSADTLSCTHVPVIARDKVIVGVEPSKRLTTEYWDKIGGKIIAYDAETGDVVWEYDRLGTDDMGTTASVGDEVVYGRHYRGLYALDAANGELIWEFESPLPSGLDPEIYDYSPPMTSQPTIVDGVIVVGTFPTGVYAVGEA